jgi:hypothetical protein
VRVGRGCGVEDDLRQPEMIARVNENQAAVIASPMYPARECHSLPDVFFAQFTTSVCF